MSGSKYEYVKDFEVHNTLLQNTFIVLRIDGKGFTKFCDNHNFEKPNDLKGIELMALAGLTVMENYDEIFLAYGQSDEFSFAFRKDAELFNRRSDKILTNVLSTFSCAYVFHWSKIFKNPLNSIPAFDARIILYPTYQNLRDYFSWRQVDCHINNLYNTTFWALVHEGKCTNEQAHKRLMKTFSKDKHEILFKEFNTNYNFLPDVYKKGTTLFRKNFDFNLMSDILRKKKKKNKKEKELLDAKITDDDYNEKNDIELAEKIQEVKLIEKENKENENDKDKENNEISTNKKYEFSYSKNFLEIIDEYEMKNISVFNGDIIQDEFWNKNNFYYK